MYIGDLPTDMMAARAAGMISAAALWGEGSQERSAPHSPHLIFDTPQSLLAAFSIMDTYSGL